MGDVRPVGYVLGWLIAALGAAMLAPLGLDLLAGDSNWRAFALASVATVVVGVALGIACRERRTRGLTVRQGFLLITGGWVALTLAATLPLIFGAPHLGVTDAFFETMSAMTTTGATVIAGLDDMPRSLLLWRGLLQWFGGIGIVLVAMILLPVLNIGGMQLLRTGDFNTLDKVLPRAKDMAVSFGTVYLALTGACALGYLWSGMSGFDALIHAMTTLSTGGMSTRDASFAGFGRGAQYVSTAFMLIGGMSFVRYLQFSRGDPRPLFTDPQIRGFLLLYLGLSAGVLLSRLLQGAPFGERMLREVLFNMASIITTTGYASADYTLWGSFAVVLVFCAGMICGCSGSTSGGPKVFRYQLLLAAVAAEVRRVYSPNRISTLHYQGRPVTPSVISSVMGFFMFFYLSLAVVAVALVLIGLAPVTAISGAATAISNIGPGLGPEIGPVGNFAGLPGAAKWLLAVTMLVGRLEVMSVFVLFIAAFWRG